MPCCAAVVGPCEVVCQSCCSLKFRVGTALFHPLFPLLFLSLVLFLFVILFHILTFVFNSIVSQDLSGIEKSPSNFVIPSGTVVFCVLLVFKTIEKN